MLVHCKMGVSRSGSTVICWRIDCDGGNVKLSFYSSGYCLCDEGQEMATGRGTEVCQATSVCGKSESQLPKTTEGI